MILGKDMENIQGRRKWFGELWALEKGAHRVHLGLSRPGLLCMLSSYYEACCIHAEKLLWIMLYTC